MARPYVAYTTASAFTETALLPDPYIVPSSSPAAEQPEAVPLLAQHEHALASSTLFLPTSRGFILARIIGDEVSLDESILELRWTSFTAGPVEGGMDAVTVLGDLDLREPLPPVRFKFPSKLVPSPPALVWAEESKTLQVLAVTEAGYLYAFTFASPQLFCSATLGEASFSEEFKVESLNGRLPVLYHGVEDGRVVIACADGYSCSVEIDEQGVGLIETELKSAASFSVRALLPSFSARNLSARLPSATESAPSQPLSFASSLNEDGSNPFAFGVTRDRKLKIWSLESGACLKALDLPRPSTSQELELHRERETDSLKTPGKKAPALLAPTPRPLLKVFTDENGASFLVLYVSASGGSPPAFFIYGILRNAAGVLSELSRVGEHVAPISGSLVDFEVSQFTIDGDDDSHWTLWTVWEESGEAEVRYIHIPELVNGNPSTETKEEWQTIDRGTGGSAQWSAGYFDDLLRENPQSITEVFADHVFFPGRYPPATLDYALAVYDEALTEEMGVHERPELFFHESATVEERICALVGCNVELEVSEHTGAYLHDPYNKRLKLEWLRFVAICNESRAAALFPLHLAVSPSKGILAVILRDAMAVPIAQDDILLLRHVAASSSISQNFLQSSPPELLAVRTDILVIFNAIAEISTTLSTQVARQLEDDLLAQARAPLTSTIEEVALDVYWRSLDPYLEEDVRDIVLAQLAGLVTPEPSFQFLWQMLTTSNLSQQASSGIDPTSAISDLTSALLANAIRTSVEARFSLSKGLVALLIFMHNHHPDLLPQLESITSNSLATFHTLASLRWVTHQPVSAPTSPSPSSDDDGIVERFNEMQVSGSASTTTLACVSLLDDLLLKSYSPPISVSSPLPKSLVDAASAFLTATGLIKSKRLVDDSLEDVAFGFQLLKIGLPELAVEFVEMYPRGSGMLYVLARAYLELGRIDESQAAFLRAASALHGGKARLDEHHGFQAVVPSSASSTLARYYQHVAVLFHDQSVKSAVVTFAALALESFAEEESEDHATLKDLWLKLFNSNAELGAYEDAYATMMSVPYQKTKVTCLSNLVTVLCENGQVALLTRLSFAGLQADLERILAFRARGSKPLSGSDYYPTLYAYHTAKGDYRSAADAMLQRARHVGADPPHGRSSRDVATLQCQSYLAAINSLSLVDTEHAWLAIESGMEGAERAGKRRKITYQIPDEEFEVSKNVEVVDLEMMRSEYTVALGRLQLLNEFPDSELIRTGLDVVIGFRQSGNFDAAFSAAQILEEDMSPTFRRLAEKCVALSTTDGLSADASWVALDDEALPWEGSLASKAWRLLERHLNRYKSSRYYVAVLEEMLLLSRDCQIPPFLSDYFVDHDPEPFLRILIVYNRLPETFRFALRTIKPSSAGPKSQTTFPSYTLFDQLLALKASDRLSIAPEELQENQDELNNALNRR